jgi:hypothetical protein
LKILWEFTQTENFDRIQKNILYFLLIGLSRDESFCFLYYYNLFQEKLACPLHEIFLLLTTNELIKTHLTGASWCYIFPDIVGVLCPNPCCALKECGAWFFSDSFEIWTQMKL